MRRTFVPQLLRLLAVLPLLAPALGGQRAGMTDLGAAPGTLGFDDVIANVPGTVVDLTYGASGRLLYCTREGELGRIDTHAGGREVLATAASAPFPFELRAVAENLVGDAVVVDSVGDIRQLPGNAPPAQRIYDDDYMVLDPTDLIVDARGNHLIASRTPSSGQWATNWIAPNGVRWGYHLVRHSPAQLAADPLTGDVLMADGSGGGALRSISSSDLTRPTTTLDDTTRPGFGIAEDDGDLACEADGDVYWIAEGSIWLHDRIKGVTALYASGFATLRGVAIAPSSSRFAPTSEWSLYVAEGANPTHIRELPGVEAPASAIAADQGKVPGRGQQRMFTLSKGIQVFDLAVDNDGNLLLGGHLYGASFSIRRYDVVTKTLSLIADANDGISGTVEGIAVAPDDTIYALTRPGTIHAITEAPLSVTTVFSDPLNRIRAGKDLALDVDGSFYVADRDSWGFGELLQVSGGVATQLAPTAESRGVSAAPGGGVYVTEWNDTGFVGSIARYDLDQATLEDVPGLEGMNYTNDSGWGDGDTVVDTLGRIYTASEDDWSVIRYDPNVEGFERFLSGFLNHPSGLALAPSTTGTQSSTGWSLYVSEFDFLWERPGVKGPASALVDSTALKGTPVATLHPRHGRPRDLVRGPGGTLFVSTSLGRILAVAPETGEVRLVAGPGRGLTGDLTAIAVAPSGAILTASRHGHLFALRPEGGQAVTFRAGVQDTGLEVVDLLLAPDGRPLLLLRTGEEGVLLRLEHGGFHALARLPAPARAAIDPLRGGLLASGISGELIGVDLASGRAREDRSARIARLAPGALDGGLAFDGEGNLYLAGARSGRIVRVDRRSGRASLVSGQHARPAGLVATAGSLFALDGWVVYAIDAAPPWTRGAQGGF